MNSPRIAFLDPDTLEIKTYGQIRDIIRINRYDDIKFAIEEFILKNV